MAVLSVLAMGGVSVELYAQESQSLARFAPHDQMHTRRLHGVRLQSGNQPSVSAGRTQGKFVRVRHWCACLGYQLSCLSLIGDRT